MSWFINSYVNFGLSYLPDANVGNLVINWIHYSNTAVRYVFGLWHIMHQGRSSYFVRLKKGGGGNWSSLKGCTTNTIPCKTNTVPGTWNHMQTSLQQHIARAPEVLSNYLASDGESVTRLHGELHPFVVTTPETPEVITNQIQSAAIPTQPPFIDVAGYLTKSKVQGHANIICKEMKDSNYINN